jgi:hypothetical protein
MYARQLRDAKDTAGILEDFALYHPVETAALVEKKNTDKMKAVKNRGGSLAWKLAQISVGVPASPLRETDQDYFPCELGDEENPAKTGTTNGRSGAQGSDARVIRHVRLNPPFRPNTDANRPTSQRSEPSKPPILQSRNKYAKISNERDMLNEPKPQRRESQSNGSYLVGQDLWNCLWAKAQEQAKAHVTFADPMVTPRPESVSSQSPTHSDSSVTRTLKRKSSLARLVEYWGNFALSALRAEAQSSPQEINPQLDIVATHFELNVKSLRLQNQQPNTADQLLESTPSPTPSAPPHQAACSVPKGTKSDSSKLSGDRSEFETVKKRKKVDTATDDDFKTAHPPRRCRTTPSTYDGFKALSPQPTQYPTPPSSTVRQQRRPAPQTPHLQTIIDDDIGDDCLPTSIRKRRRFEPGPGLFASLRAPRLLKADTPMRKTKKAAQNRRKWFDTRAKCTGLGVYSQATRVSLRNPQDSRYAFPSDDDLLSADIPVKSTEHLFPGQKPYRGIKDTHLVGTAPERRSDAPSPESVKYITPNSKVPSKPKAPRAPHHRRFQRVVPESAAIHVATVAMEKRELRKAKRHVLASKGNRSAASKNRNGLTLLSNGEQRSLRRNDGVGDICVSGDSHISFGNVEIETLTGNLQSSKRKAPVLGVIASLAAPRSASFSASNLPKFSGRQDSAEATPYRNTRATSSVSRSSPTQLSRKKNPSVSKVTPPSPERFPLKSNRPRRRTPKPTERLIASAQQATKCNPIVPKAKTTSPRTKPQAKSTTPRIPTKKPCKPCRPAGSLTHAKSHRKVHNKFSKFPTKLTKIAKPTAVRFAYSLRSAKDADQRTQFAKRLSDALKEDMKEFTRLNTDGTY